MVARPAGGVVGDALIAESIGMGTRQKGALPSLLGESVTCPFMMLTITHCFTMRAAS